MTSRNTPASTGTSRAVHMVDTLVEAPGGRIARSGGARAGRHLLPPQRHEEWEG
ncbi:hypothetical protein [Pseudonocardia broussonetiae]|uniref:Uncharacterized protein n=1 Tax=Pseudonocardia broussonetiae TaxID=2736640 RepID=A0A6M6JM18_9PSEU|nr:hypothetical protein [Pseudonocardia broussonetiae]QJY47977.1 hypothetical protein HOP40_21040 [Pseudonocardia broussonetiae]